MTPSCSARGEGTTVNFHINPRPLHAGTSRRLRLDGVPRPEAVAEDPLYPSDAGEALDSQETLNPWGA